MRGTNPYPKIKQKSKSLVWQALQFRKMPWKDFKMPEGQIPKRTCKCVQDKLNTSLCYGRRHSGLG